MQSIRTSDNDFADFLLFAGGALFGLSLLALIIFQLATGNAAFQKCISGVEITMPHLGTIETQAICEAETVGV